MKSVGRILTVPGYDPSFDGLCEAVRWLRLRGGVRACLELLPALGELVEVPSSSGSDSDCIVVLTGPTWPATTQNPEGYFAELANLSPRRLGLPVIAALADPPDDHVARFRRAGVRDILVVDEVNLPVALGVRLMTWFTSKFTSEFLMALPPDAPGNGPNELVLLLERLAAGGVPVIREIVSSGRLEAGSPGDLTAAAVVYTGLRGVREGRIELGHAASDLGFSDVAGLDRTCGNLVGVSFRHLVAEGGWREFLTRFTQSLAMDPAPSALEREAGAQPDMKLGEDGQRGAYDFPRILTEYPASAFRAARNMLGSREEAEDVVGEVVTAVLRMGPGKWNHVSEGYMIRAARNRARNLLRRRRRQAGLKPLDEVLPPACRPQINRTLKRRALREAIRLGLTKIPPRQAVALWLRHGLTWPATDVAELIGTSPAAVRNLCSRAEDAVREYFKPVWREWMKEDLRGVADAGSAVTGRL